MKTCPFFGLCGGCKYDFASPDYRKNKLQEINKLPITSAPIWTHIATRRRADFAFANGVFGFYQHHSKNIVPIQNCPLILSDLNAVLPQLATLPWNGSGSCLITLCDNGIDIAINSSVPYFSTNFKNAAEKLKNVIRITWCGRTIIQKATPTVTFKDKTINFPSGAFLQPTIQSETILREMVITAVKGSHRIADLFCGLGNFTFAVHADGFDINGIGIKQDLFIHPLPVTALNKYDCVIMDPPRAGAFAQCKELAKSDVKKIVYISCNPATWERDARILVRAGYQMPTLVPVDQFVGSAHWELFSVFNR